MTDYHGSTTTYSYYDDGRLSTLTAPGSKTWSYVYNGLGEVSTVSIPNGMTTAYGYDARHRLTKIEHKDGNMVLDGWTYALTPGGNITRTDQADGSYWAYAYDGRNRLTLADRYESSGSGIHAHYAYSYSAADNMLTKVEPFKDDFSDGNYSGWSQSASWSASGGYMAESTADWTQFYRSNDEPDLDLRFRYSTGDTADWRYGNIVFRQQDSTHVVYLQLATNTARLLAQDGGTTTTLDEDSSADSEAGTWYNVRILCDGSDVTVWRGTDGGSMDEILSTSSAPYSTTSQLRYISGANASFAYDNIEVIADDWTRTTTMAYNAGNELTGLTADGAASMSFGYDSWGNMTSKSDGTSTANYYWHYGGKLTRVASTFPTEGTVTYAYGGDQKRRDRDDGTVTKYRWDAGWNMVNEEGSGGDLVMTYARAPMGPVGSVLADLAGSSPASGTARYYGLDNLGSTRSLWSGDKDTVGSYAYTPYGAGFALLGAAVSTHYTGHYWDHTIGITSTHYRQYDPELTRWLSRDPLGLGSGPNPYCYVHGRPISYVDPDGRSMVIGAIVVAVIVIVVIVIIVVSGGGGGETPAETAGRKEGEKIGARLAKQGLGCCDEERCTMECMDVVPDASFPASTAQVQWLDACVDACMGHAN